MSNSNKWQAFVSGTESLSKPSAHVKSIKMIAAQRQHVKKLQEKIKEDEKNFFAALMNVAGWEYFMTRHTLTYNRPKNGIHHLKKLFTDIDIVFDKEEGIPTTAAFIITYTPWDSYSSQHYLKFRTKQIPISEIEEFIENKE